MINNEFATTATDRIINTLADAILDDDNATISLDDLPALADLLTMRTFYRLAAAIDACPYHHCDLDTCDDDNLNCSDRLHQYLMTAAD
jgi:hypothetical protein